MVPDVTAKVFRTWKASTILQEELDKIRVDEDSTDSEKKARYDEALIKVALALNHKRLAGGTDEKMRKIEEKIKEYQEKKEKAKTEAQKKRIQTSIDNQKIKLSAAEENVAVSTSKANYLDPRISVVYCKRHELPIEKVYNKSILRKFKWAMDTKTTWKF